MGTRFPARAQSVYTRPSFEEGLGTRLIHSSDDKVTAVEGTILKAIKVVCCCEAKRDFISIKKWTSRGIDIIDSFVAKV